MASRNPVEESEFRFKSTETRNTWSVHIHFLYILITYIMYAHIIRNFNFTPYYNSLLILSIKFVFVNFANRLTTTLADDDDT